jgi:hypothetical protein
MFCSFAYVKKIPQFLLIQLKYKLKGKKRFSGFTGLEADGFSVLILSKTAQAYPIIALLRSNATSIFNIFGSVHAMRTKIPPFDSV